MLSGPLKRNMITPVNISPHTYHGTVPSITNIEMAMATIPIRLKMGESQKSMLSVDMDTTLGVNPKDARGTTAN